MAHTSPFILLDAYPNYTEHTGRDFGAATEGAKANEDAKQEVTA